MVVGTSKKPDGLPEKGDNLSEERENCGLDLTSDHTQSPKKIQDLQNLHGNTFAALQMLQKDVQFPSPKSSKRGRKAGAQELLPQLFVTPIISKVCSPNSNSYIQTPLLVFKTTPLAPSSTKKTESSKITQVPISPNPTPFLSPTLKDVEALRPGCSRPV